MSDSIRKLNEPQASTFGHLAGYLKSCETFTPDVKPIEPTPPKTQSKQFSSNAMPKDINSCKRLYQLLSVMSPEQYMMYRSVLQHAHQHDSREYVAHAILLDASIKRALVAGETATIKFVEQKKLAVLFRTSCLVLLLAYVAQIAVGLSLSLPLLLIPGLYIAYRLCLLYNIDLLPR